MEKLRKASVLSPVRGLVSGLLIFASAPAWPADLTIPNTFTAGTAAVASQVNANFAAAATAVNSKQDRVTGNCPGQSIQTVNANGSVTCASGPDSSGVEFANEGTSTAITVNDTMVATIDVTAPAAGYLIASSMGNAICTNAASLLVRLHNVTTAVSSSAILGENRPTAGQVGYYSINYVFQVAAGLNTVTVTGSCTNGGGSMTALTLNAIFVPNRY